MSIADFRVEIVDLPVFHDGKFPTVFIDHEKERLVVSRAGSTETERLEAMRDAVAFMVSRSPQSSEIPVIDLSDWR